MDNLSMAFNFENQIKNDEKAAYQRFQSAAERICKNKVTNQFQDRIEKEIIPALKMIGFDKMLLEVLFMIAAPAWYQMKFDVQNNIIFQPFMIKKISDVKIGIIEEQNHKTEYFFNLHTPWIILPRVYNHIEKNDSQTLPIYIKFLKQDENIEFKKILSHIIINYFGNYSLKFISNNQMRRSVSDMLFYGYLSMFWKNLRCPPEGFEEYLIFKNFLTLIQSFPGNMCFLNKCKSHQIKKMKNAVRDIFPIPSAFGVYAPHKIDFEKLFLVLRHGPAGIEIALDHFCVNKHLRKETTNGGIPHIMLPKAIWGFLKLVKKKYGNETLRTKAFIRKFIRSLHTNYSTASIFTGCRSFEQDKFLKQRVFSIISEFST